MEIDHLPPTKPAWGLIPIICMLILTFIFPIYGIIVGIWDMGSPGPRKTQGIALFAFGLFMGLIWTIAFFG